MMTMWFKCRLWAKFGLGERKQTKRLSSLIFCMHVGTRRPFLSILSLSLLLSIPGYGFLKSMTLTTLLEKHAATLVSSAFHATSNMSPLPRKLRMCCPSATLHM